MLITGEPVDAPEAERLGLINHAGPPEGAGGTGHGRGGPTPWRGGRWRPPAPNAVPPEELDGTVQAWAEKLAAGPTSLIASIKFAAYRGADLSFAAALAPEAVAIGEASRSEAQPGGR